MCSLIPYTVPDSLIYVPHLCSIFPLISAFVFVFLSAPHCILDVLPLECGRAIWDHSDCAILLGLCYSGAGVTQALLF